MHAVLKIVWYLLQPTSLVLLASVLAFWLAIRGQVQLARRIAVTVLAVIGLFGAGPLSDLLIIPLEARFPRPVLGANDQIAGLIVLGGSEDPASARPGTPVVMSVNEAGERLMEAASLARLFPNARIVLSGGSGNVIAERTPEAVIAANTLEALGVARARMVLETQSRTTFENAALTRVVINQKPGERWLLVTSAWHMPRSMAVFRKAGIVVEPWPVDYRTRSSIEVLKVNSNVFEGLRRLDYATKEWAGLIGYRLTGRTDTLFPAP